jgi:septum formation protein
MLPILNRFQLVLGSKSPRRQELLAGMGFNFTVRTKETEESFPETLIPRNVPVFLAQKKAEALIETLSPNELLITSDTIVLLDQQIFGKPVDFNEAKKMLQQLSGKAHEVITGVCLQSVNKSTCFSVSTKVYFNPITDEMITYYINNYQPFDKAGSYGIQEWIGYVAIQKIEGSYFNVVGLPVAELWDALVVF